MRKILYIGGFKLPDKNAAAHRVINTAKIMKLLGHEVIFFNLDDNCGVGREKNYLGFKCIEEKKNSEIDYVVFAKQVISIINETCPDVVIAYNYPSFALRKVKHYCGKHSIKCVADITEWYEPHGSLIHKIVMMIDTEYRMNHVLYQMDGIIAISKFLYTKYKKSNNTICIPPLVDIEEEKWKYKKHKDAGIIKFVYAGVPCKSKERLDLIVKAIANVSKIKNVKLVIIGVTREQYKKIYSDESAVDSCIDFKGYINHEETIRTIIDSDWSIIIRENNRLVKAGFPTKLAETIACGTPVIINEFSNVFDYIDESNGIRISDNNIEKALLEACDKNVTPDRLIFDYRLYTEDIKKMFIRMGL